MHQKTTTPTFTKNQNQRRGTVRLQIPNLRILRPAKRVFDRRADGLDVAEDRH